jgi:hypothetical protein
MLYLDAALMIVRNALETYRNYVCDAIILALGKTVSTRRTLR